MKKLSGYVRVEKPYHGLNLMSDYVMISEELVREAVSGLVLPPLSNAVIGEVLKVGPGVRGVIVGDRVMFTAWKGGRWTFLDETRYGGDRKCLIMKETYVMAVLR